MSELPKVTVIVPTLNSERLLEQCLKSIYEQDYPNFNIIVVDQGSKDNTLRIASKYSVKILHIPGKMGKALQSAVESADGELIGILDSDSVLPHDHWLKNMVTCFDTPSPIGVAWTLGWFKKGDPIVMRCCALAWERIPPRIISLSNIRPVGAGHDVFSKKAIMDVGGFNTKLGYREGFDLDLTRRIVNNGYLLVYCNDRVYHYSLTTFTRYLRRRLGYAKALQKRTRRTANLDGTPKQSITRLTTTFFRAIKGYSRDKDVAWFIYPILSFIDIVVYMVYTAPCIIIDMLGLQTIHK